MMKRDQDYQSQADDVVTDDEFEKDEVVFAVEAAGPAPADGSSGRRPGDPSGATARTPTAAAGAAPSRSASPLLAAREKRG